MFGDETADYGSALQTYYAYGPAADWTARTVTAYASSHPWEDWAETWAHYLHLFDTMETAAAYGLRLDSEAPSMEEKNFDEMWQRWHPFTVALNAVNRGMGLPDLYPFVVPPPALEKLRFVHEVIQRARAGAGNAPMQREARAAAGGVLA